MDNRNLDDLLLDINKVKQVEVKRPPEAKEKEIRESRFGEQTEKLLIDVSAISKDLADQKRLNSSFAYKDAAGNTVVNINGMLMENLKNKGYLQLLMNCMIS